MGMGMIFSHELAKGIIVATLACVCVDIYAAAPSVSTLSASSISTDSATLRGTVNPNGITTYVFFEYGLTASYGNTTAYSSGLTGNSSISMQAVLTGLEPNTTYHFRMVGLNSNGQWGWGNDRSFITDSETEPPSVTTSSAINIDTTSATMRGTVDPNGTTTSAFFEWGRTSSYGNTTDYVTGLTGSSAISLQSTLTGLDPDTTYHYRLAAVNSEGQWDWGSDRTFATDAETEPPTATTSSAIDIGLSTATLRGSVNPNGTTTAAFFEYGLTTSYGNTTDYATGLTGNSSIAIQSSLTGLNSNTTYHFRMVALNSEGQWGWGNDQAFTTASAVLPVVTTLAATLIATTSAQLNGTVNPNGRPASAWFLYGEQTNNMGTVDSPQDVGSGSSPVTVSTSLTGLTPNTTYHVKLTGIGDSAVVGNDVTFTTASSDLPTITIIAPDGGETVQSGITLPISWSVTGNVAPISFFFVEYSLDGGASWSLFDYVAGSGRSSSWAIPIETSTAAARIRVRAFDSTGSLLATDSSDANFTITAGGTQPVAVPDCNNNAPASGVTVTFYGTTSRPSSGNPAPTIVSYSWNFGDGGTASGATVSHAFNAVGMRTYNVSLTVTDSMGLSDTRSMNVTVTGQALGPDTPQSKSDDPVNLATGNFLYDHVDLAIPGIGFPFTFQRFYNSKDAGNTNGPMGLYWSHSYNVRVNSSSGIARVTFGDGRSETYTNYAGAYLAETGIYNTLSTNDNGAFALNMKDQTRYNFNASGRLASIVDKNSNTFSLSYNGSGALTVVTNSAGRVVTFVNDANNRVIRMIDPLGRTNAYEYNAQGDLVSATDPRGGVTRYGYDADHQMTNAVDPNGNQFVRNVYSLNRVVEAQRDALGNLTTFTYNFVTRETVVSNALGFRQVHKHDEHLRVVQITDEAGNIQNFEYDEFNNRTKVVDKNRRTTTYTYDVRGNVTSKTDPSGNVTTIGYDPLNNPTNRMDSKLGRTAFNFDGRGNLTKTVNPQDFTNTVTYSAKGLPLLIRDANGNSLSNAFDGAGNLISSRDALGYIRTYTYDAAGRKVTEVDPNNATNRFVYDGNNNLLRSIDPLGYTNVFAYDANNNQVLIQDARGHQTIKTYDPKDRLVSVRDPLGGVTSNAYDALDRRIATTDPRGNVTRFAYDLVGNLVAVSNALGQVTRFTYDPNGNQLTSVNPLGQVTSNECDVLNRLIAVTDSLGNVTRYAYDELDRRTQVTDANSKITRFFYDPLGWLTNVIDAATGAVHFAYDKVGNRTAMTEPNGRITIYAYDALNRLTQKQEPVGTYQYRYDGAGNRIGLTDAKGQSITNVFDANRRLTAVKYADGSQVAFAYDPIGNRIRMTDAQGTTTYAYDALNRMTNCTDSAGKTVAYTYDANGNRVAMTYPGNRVVSYTFDALNRMETVADWLGGVTTNTYDAAGNLVQVRNPNGTTTRYGFDDAGRLTSLTNARPDASVISSYALDLDGVGNHLQSVQVDPIEPLISTQTVSYAYDTDNRLTNAAGTVFTYDANGNMTAKGADTFAYDYENRLTNAVVGGIAHQYQYDGVGNRLRATRGGVTTRYVLDVNGTLAHVLAEADAAGTITAYYVYGRGLVSRITAGGSASHYHYDLRGSTVAMTDSGGNVTDKYAYDPFGTVVNTTGTLANPFKYVGRYGVMDEGTGLAYIRARYYSPSLGRFVTKDPVTGKDGDSQSLNRYIYALNNPVRLVDVSGFCASPSFSEYGSSDGLNDLLLGFGGRLVTNLRNALYSEAIDAYVFDQLFDRLGDSASGYMTFRDSASILQGIIQEGIAEVQSRGDIVDALRNLSLNIEFARRNPGALLDALEDGFESITAVAVNAAMREASRGYIDPGLTGEDLTGMGASINRGINAGLDAYLQGIQWLGGKLGGAMYNLAPGVFQ
jgi:RHS repeat-associated protein